MGRIERWTPRRVADEAFRVRNKKGFSDRLVLLINECIRQAMESRGNHVSLLPDPFLCDIIMAYEFSDKKVCDEIADKMVDQFGMSERDAKRHSRLIYDSQNNLAVHYEDLWKLRQVVKETRERVDSEKRGD